MEKGYQVARATFLLVIAAFLSNCSKPNINSAVSGVVTAMNGISSNLNSALGGGYTLSEAKKCQMESINIKKPMKLPTKAKVTMEIYSNSFKLYTEEHAFTDFDDNTLYEIDLDKKTFTNYEQKWIGAWKAKSISLPPIENEKFISKPDYSKVKKLLDFNNPFTVPRMRLGVRLGLGANILSEKDSSLLLNEGQIHAVTCAGALNAYYEALLKTEYEFKDE